MLRNKNLGMKKIIVNVSENNNISKKWIAYVTPTLIGKNNQNAVTIGESLQYLNKQQAWNSIKNKVESLNFKKDEIYFNNMRVNEIQEIINLLDLL